MTKILLVYVNSYMDNLVPLGISGLSACLKKSGHDVKLFDTTLYRTREESGDDARVAALQIKKTNLTDFGIVGLADVEGSFLRTLEEYSPDLIGFSVVESTWSIARRLLAIAKKYPAIKVVGGIHATMASDLIIGVPEVDIVCVGEGERALVELADCIGSKRDYSKINNLVIKQDGKVLKNPIGPLANLDELPDQDWTLYDRKRFYKPMGGKIWISGPIELSRGCPYHCSFCCNDHLHELYGGKGKYYRERGVDRFINELKTKKVQYGLEYLYLVSENFLQMSASRFARFIEQYQDLKMPFWIETRPETVTLEKAKKLKAIGCEGISIGVEHGNDDFRRRMLKRFVSDEVIKKAFFCAHEAGMRVCANNIIGFPEETYELVFDTIKLNRALKATNVITNIFVPYRGTPLWQACVDRGYIDKDDIAGDYRMDSVLNMPQLSAERVKGLQRTFPLYVKLPQRRWPDIKRAESLDVEGNKIFELLAREYRECFM